MHTKLTTTLLAALLVLAASCGSGTGLTAPGLDSTGRDNEVGITGGALPALPAESGKALSGAADMISVPGADVFVSQNAAVLATSLVLSSSETDLAWGLYKVTGLDGKKVTGFVIEMQPATLETQYSVGVSNFSEGVWDFPVTSSLPEFEYSFTDEMERRTSALGSFYFVVIAAGGAQATVLQTTIFSRALEPGEIEMPVFGGDIAASEGLADKVVVQWAAVAGATTYELWREADIEGQDEAAQLLASLPAVAGQASYAYEDFAVTPSTEYKYRIRGLNEAGSGAFSRWVSGWAGTTPPLEDPNGNPGEGLELTGTLESISDTGIVVDGQPFETNDATIWLDGNKAVTDKGAFTPGMLVEVDANALGEGAWLATSVQDETEDGAEPPVDELTLTGAIEALDGGGITVGGTLFAILDTTEWLDLLGQPALPEDFAVGGMVEVTGDADGLGGWNARRVQAEDAAAPEELTLLGAIEALDAGSITVSATAFAITGETLWQDHLGGSLTAADFAVGDLVEIQGSADGSGGWNAVLVKKQDAGGDDGGAGGEIDVDGLIEAIDAAGITVDGTSFSTDELTDWQDENHDPAAPGDFSVGMLVSVSGSGSPDNWHADRVRMEGGDN